MRIDIDAEYPYCSDTCPFLNKNQTECKAFEYDLQINPYDRDEFLRCPSCMDEESIIIHYKH